MWVRRKSEPFPEYGRVHRARGEIPVGGDVSAACLRTQSPGAGIVHAQRPSYRRGA